MRDVYEWVDPWPAVERERAKADASAALRDHIIDLTSTARLSAALRKSDDGPLRFDAKTQDERDSPVPVIHEMTITEARQHMGSPAPTPDRSVPIWLLAIIMLGIAFGVPMIAWLTASALASVGLLS